MRKLVRVATMLRRLGLPGTLRYLFVGRLLDLRQALLGRNRGNVTYRLTSNSCRHPLICRLGTSDRVVFSQVFIDTHYAVGAGSAEPRTIVDCGANVGYSSAYFLSKYENARLLAVEPEPGNYRQACANLAAFGARATVVQAGLWSQPAGLKIVRRPYRDGEEWAFQVRECEDGETADIHAVDIPELLGRLQTDRIGILKMDIEGSEEQVFSRNAEAWVGRVDQFQIELHSEACRLAFEQALGDGGFNFERTGEITVATRLPPDTAKA